MTICERVVDLLHKKSMTRKELAEKIEVPPSTVHTWMLRGEDFPARHASACAEALGVSVAFLLTGEEDPLSAPPPGYVKLSDDELFIVNALRELDIEGRLHIQGETVQELRRVKLERGGGAGAEADGSAPGSRAVGRGRNHS